MAATNAGELLALMRNSIQRKVMKTGNPLGITIPKPFRAELGLEYEDEVLLLKPGAEPPDGFEENLVCRVYKLPDEDDAVPEIPDQL